MNPSAIPFSVDDEDVLERTRRRISDTMESIRLSASNIADTMQSEILHNTKVLRTVATMLEDGLILLDKDNKITIFNPSASSIFGVNADIVVGQRFSEVFPSLAKRLLPASASVPVSEQAQKDDLLFQGREQGVQQPGLITHAHVEKNAVGNKSSVMLSAASFEGSSEAAVPFSVLVARRQGGCLPSSEEDVARDEALAMFNQGLWNFPLPVFSSDTHGNNIKGSGEFFDLMGIDPLAVTGYSVDEILPHECLAWYYKEEQRSTMRFTAHTTRGMLELEAHKSLLVSPAKTGSARGFVTCLVRQPVLTTEITFASSFIKALDAIDRPMMMISFSEGRVLLVNKAFCTKYHYDRVELLNKSVGTVLTSTFAFDSLRRSFIVSLANGEEPVGSFDIVDAAGTVCTHKVKAIAISPEGSVDNLPKYCLLSEC